MDSWSTEAGSPRVKFDLSPAESFLSIPGDVHPPLFGSESSDANMNPLEIMTPESFADDRKPDVPAQSGATAADSETPTSSPSTEKKSKKRKSWGQVLPEPKTNLPPRY